MLTEGELIITSVTPNETNVKSLVTTKEEQAVLKEVLTIRFTLAKGVVTDSSTGLMWAAKDNGKNINWKDAKSYAENYKAGGYADWRLPTSTELEGLYKAGIKYSSGDIINISHCCPWASETRGSEAAYFDFYNGCRNWTHQSNSATVGLCRCALAIEHLVI